MSIGIGSGGGQDLTSLYQSLINTINSNSSSGITESQFQNAVSTLDPNADLTSSQTKSLFNELDTNGDGTVSSSEMMSALQSAGAQMQANMPPPPSS